jgi:hypothetical protein
VSAGRVRDDHFVYACVPQAEQGWVGFFASWLAGAPIIAGP